MAIKKVILALLPVLLVLTAFISFSQTWYEQADERIEQIRKGDFSIQVLFDGSPNEDSIYIELIKHEFQWGTAMNFYSYGTADEEWYEQTAVEYFNCGVIESNFKWPHMEFTNGDAYYTRVNNYLDWADSVGWDLRGHTLIWGGENATNMPSWILYGGYSADSLYSLCERRVKREMEYYKGRIKEYDVINEAVPGHADWLQTQVGDSINWDVFKWAKEADSTAELYINEYNAVEFGTSLTAYKNLISEVISNGAELDGIGVQCHFGTSLDWSDVKTRIDDLYNTFGLPVKITEFDMDGSIAQSVQADEYEEMLTTAFSHPAVNGFYFWGFWDARHWRTDAGMFDDDKTPKLAATRVYNLIHNTWSTNISSKTDASGNIDFRCFYGDYKVTVKIGSCYKVYYVSCKKADEGTPIVISTDNTSPFAEAGDDQTICSGESTVLTADGGVDESVYAWNTGSTTSSVTVTPSVTATYTVSINDGCVTDSDNVIVYVNGLPTADAGSDISICDATVTTLTASGGVSYLWNNDETTQIITVMPSFNCGDDYTDARNGMVYHTVEIDGKCWMAQNMDIGTMINGVTSQVDNGIIEKYCYNDIPSSCDVYGGLYQWDEIMQYSVSEGVQGICPEGWHIPTDAEWHNLESFYSTGTCSSTRTAWGCEPAGKKLYVGGESDFNVLATGRRNSSGGFENLNSDGYFWPSTENGTNAWRRNVSSSVSITGVYRGELAKTYGCSVRCVKDTGTSQYSNYYYTVTVADNNNCSDADDIVVSIETCTDVTDNNTLNIKVYPNPAKTNTNIVIGENVGKFNIVIYNAYGQPIYNNEVNIYETYVIDVSIYLPGIYYIKIENNSAIVLKKLIIF